MATEVIRTIRASGGDYTSLSTFQAAEVRDLVAADEIAVAECYDDWPTGLDDSVVINGWITSLNNYVKIVAADGHKHTGSLDSGFTVRKSSSYFRVINNLQEYTVIEGIAAEGLGSYCYAVIANDDNSSSIIKQCVAKNSTNNTAYSLSGGTVHSSIALGSKYGGRTDSYLSRDSFYINCTFANCTYGVHSGSYQYGNNYVQNCVAYNCGTSYFSDSTWAADCTNNAASDGSTNTPPGSNPITTDVVSGDFADAANDDFHLAPGSALIGAGANLYTDGSDVDIDGDAWPNSAWDIGFDYYVASGPDYSLTASSVKSSSNLSKSTISQKFVLSSDSINASLNISKSIIAQKQNFTTSAINSNTDVSKSTIQQKHDVLSNSLVSNTAVEKSSISEKHTLSVYGINSNLNISKSSMSQIHNVTSLGINTIINNSKSSVSQKHIFVSNSVDCATNIAKSTISDSGYSLLSNGILSNISVSKSGVSQKHNVSSIGIESQSNIAKSTISQHRLLYSNSINSGAAISKGSISNDYVLFGNGVASNTNISKSIISQAHILVPKRIEGITNLSKGVISQYHYLNSFGIIASSYLSKPHILPSDYNYKCGQTKVEFVEGFAISLQNNNFNTTNVGDYTIEFSGDYSTEICL